MDETIPDKQLHHDVAAAAGDDGHNTITAPVVEDITASTSHSEIEAESDKIEQQKRQASPQSKSPRDKSPKRWLITSSTSEKDSTCNYDTVQSNSTSDNQVPKLIPTINIEEVSPSNAPMSLDPVSEKIQTSLDSAAEVVASSSNAEDSISQKSFLMEYGPSTEDLISQQSLELNNKKPSKNQKKIDPLNIPMSEDEAESLGELLVSWEKIRYYLGLGKKDITMIKKCSMGDYELEKCDTLRRWADKVKHKATPNKLIKAATKAGEKLFARNIENYFALKSSDDTIEMRPEVPQLQQALTAVAMQWSGLGLQLGLTSEQLDQLVVEPPKQRLQTMMTLWLEQNNSGSWRDVVNALRKIERYDIAVRVAKQHYLEKETKDEILPTIEEENGNYVVSPELVQKVTPPKVREFPTVTLDFETLEEILEEYGHDLCKEWQFLLTKLNFPQNKILYLQRHFLINGNTNKKILLAQDVNARANAGKLTWDHVRQLLEELYPTSSIQVDADRPDEPHVCDRQETPKESTELLIRVCSKPKYEGQVAGGKNTVAVAALLLLVVAAVTIAVLYYWIVRENIL